VVSSCNFNLVNTMLLINESIVGAFLLTTLYLIYLVITLCISFIFCTCWVPTIIVVNLAIFPSHSNLLLRSWRRLWSKLIWCSRWVIASGQLHVELWCLSTAMLLRVFDLVYYKTLFGNKYIILRHWLFCIHFLNGMCVNLISGRTYYEHLFLA
jgi:hypothetical protein